MLKYVIMGAVFFAAIMGTAPAASAQTVILELFTSQGCSACPAADALMKRMAADDPDIVPLSLHVHYWDYLGWKDPYSSAGNTARQRGYAAALGDSQIFTPQLIVNGTQSALGSDEAHVRMAVMRAKQTPPPVHVSIAPDLTVAFDAGKNPPANASLWEISFDRYARTDVKAGENRGRMLENINNVTAVKYLGDWPAGTRQFSIHLAERPQDGALVMVQRAHEGPILGAAVYSGPAR